MLSPVCLSVTRVDQSETVKDMIVQLSPLPQSSSVTLGAYSFLLDNLTAKFQREHRWQVRAAE